MSKVTSKYQVSIPKSLAEKIGIQVGDELEWEEAAGILAVAASEVVPVAPAPAAAPVEAAPNLLAPAMAAMGTPGIGADASGGGGDVDYVTQILSAATAATGQRFGVKGTH